MQIIQMPQLPLPPAFKDAGSGYVKVAAIVRREDVDTIALAMQVAHLVMQKSSRNATVANGRALLAMCEEFLGTYPELVDVAKEMLAPPADDADQEAA